ncbi:MAG: hypothetical protein ACRD6U_08095 [Nitrososphaeraceae archaeon]
MNIVNRGLPIPADFYIELRDKISDIMYLGTGIKSAEMKVTMNQTMLMILRDIEMAY